MKSSADIRQQFLDFFGQKNHTILPSSALVPAGDDTLLFTNAGMVQFKDVFLGLDKRDYTRATTSQRCVRAGGKHNDLENVGYTARHHTFFEMLGNFSFGDYFKEEAIAYAWEFLTKVVGLPEEKLWVTVFEEDQEAEDIWLKKIGIDPARFSRIGAKDNFWQMGDTGPCGPCSEIFYDHGEHVWGGPPGTPEEDGDRYIEIWNLVFMQYNRDANGTLTPLPKPSVDTGMGLERLAAILQNVHSNYEIDIFQHLIKAAAKAVGTQDLEHASLRVIADHIRSCAFLIVDGVLPSNEGRGYVLRRIIRRACRHGHKLGQTQPFFHTLVDELVIQMGGAYPELTEQKDNVASALLKEEQRFAETLSQGMSILNTAIEKQSDNIIAGETVFQLYDTYGFPVDLTADIAREQNLELDMDGYEACMNEQRERARAAGTFGTDLSKRIEIEADTEFTGYQTLEDSSEITHLFLDSEATDHVSSGQKAVIILKNTPFYAESGGQVGDRGVIQGKGFVFNVEDTQKQGSTFLHFGTVSEGTVSVGDAVTCAVNESLRKETESNHSATHLAHWALRKVLGDHVAQKGSLVNEAYMRFDFSQGEPITQPQLQEAERLVNAEIRKNHTTESKVMKLDDAKKAGAMALFGEKYGDDVRVVYIGDYSVELCGGTHVKQTGDIGLFKITAETGIASGVRRIEAVTGAAAEQWVQETDTQVKGLTDLLKIDRLHLSDKVKQLQSKQKELEKTIEQLKNKVASQSTGDLTAQVRDIQGIQVLSTIIDGADVKVLRSTLDALKDKLGTCAIVLGSVEEGKVKLIAGVSKDATDRLKAGELVNHVASQVGGKGGGRPDMAQAGGSQPENLPQAIESIYNFTESLLS